MKIKGCINTGYAGCKHEFEYELSEIGYNEESWLELSEKDQDNVLEEILQTEIGNRIDSNIWIEDSE